MVGNGGSRAGGRDGGGAPGVPDWARGGVVRPLNGASAGMHEERRLSSTPAGDLGVSSKFFSFRIPSILCRLFSRLFPVPPYDTNLSFNFFASLLPLGSCYKLACP